MQLSRLCIICLSLAAVAALGQESEFGFDASGNNVSESPENLATPQILTQPQMQVVVPGQLASFFVVAADTTGLGYQWLFNGTNVPGATSDTLFITNVSTNNQGQYSVLLSNSAGSVTSSPAPLWIDSRGCGMPDWWQLYYFGNLTQNPSGDFDGDGVSNLQEFLDGTNPTNSASALFRLTILNNGGQVDFSPNQSVYTNGQVVTLTATALAPYSFRGWDGDLKTTNNPVTITMTTNRFVVAYLGPLDLLWTNPFGGDWNQASNWTPNVVPGQYDNASIFSSVTVTQGTAADCAVLNLGTANAFPTLTCNGTLSLHVAAFWGNGGFDGTGRVIVLPGAVFNTTNYYYSIGMGTCTLENGGTVLLTGNGLGFTMLVTNRPGALFEVQTSGSIGGYPGRFDNAGTFRKSVSPGTATLLANLNNYGVVDIEAGTLLCSYGVTNNGIVTLAPGTTNQLAGGGTAIGSFNNPASALVLWTGGTFTLNPGAQLNGPGIYLLNGGVVNFNTDLVVQNLQETGVFGGVTTLNENANLTISNLMTWSFGSISGNGRLIIAPGATLNGASTPYTLGLGTCILENGGTVLWTGTGGLSFNTLITNRPGALFDDQTATTFYGGRFDNAGTLRKSISSGTTTLDAILNNYATVDIQAGTLVCAYGVTNNGSIFLAPGTTNQFAGGGAASGSFNNPASATVLWSGNTFALNPGAQLTGAGIYVLNGAIMNFNTDLAVQNLQETGVLGSSTTLNENANLTISNLMTWTFGSVAGNGRLIIAPGAMLNAAASPYSLSLSTCTLENGGTVVWTGPGALNFNTLVTNRAGALFDAQTAGSLGVSGARFDNAGTLRKSVSTGTTGLNVPLNNYGTTDIRLGILAANNGYNSAANALLNCGLAGATAATNYGQLQVSGTVTLNGNVSVDFTNGFYPNTNNSFTVVTAGTRSGAFSNFFYPSNLVTMQLSNSPNSVVLRVTGLTTNGPPEIVNLPSAQVFYAGRALVASAVVAGAPPFTYQWTQNGSNLVDGGRISGSQASTLTISNANYPDAGSYVLLVTNSQGFAQSTPEAVTVQGVPKLNAAGAGWTLQGTTPPPMGSNTVTLTSGLGGTARSVFYNAPLFIGAFNAAFIYTDTDGGGADGVTFCMQNDARGAAALGAAGGGLGYGGITPSVAFAINIYSGNTPGIALWQNGAVLPPYGLASPVNLASGHPIFVDLLYTNGVLKTTLVESNTANVFTTNYTINLPAVLSGQTAYVGFTGGDGGVASTQVISNFTFVPLTAISVDTAVPNAPALWWPAVIGGYTLQTRSNLVPGADIWQTSPIPINQIGTRNQVTISPSGSERFYRLSISPAQ